MSLLNLVIIQKKLNYKRFILCPLTVLKNCQNKFENPQNEQKWKCQQYTVHITYVCNVTKCCSLQGLLTLGRTAGSTFVLPQDGDPRGLILVNLKHKIEKYEYEYNRTMTIGAFYVNTLKRSRIYT